MSATDLHVGLQSDQDIAWTTVCRLDAIARDTGLAALVAGRQVAVFRLADETIMAIDHHDPCSGANVLARGIVGDVDGQPVVASPVYKQRFLLATGVCLDADLEVTPHPARVRDGFVQVGHRAQPASTG